MIAGNIGGCPNAKRVCGFFRLPMAEGINVAAPEGRDIHAGRTLSEAAAALLAVKKIAS
jgi:hypothetical protein